MSARAALQTLPAADHGPGSVAALSVDGMRFFVSFVLNAHEDQRRRRMGVGAVTDRRLLHALWELPEGLPVRWDDVDPVDGETLRRFGRGVVDDDGDLVCRSYRPVCRVTTVAVVAARLGNAVRRVGELPPIFRRLAVATGARPVARSEIDLARCYGIGAVVLTASETTRVADPAPPQLGFPTVYRWWVSELAYRNSSYTV